MGIFGRGYSGRVVRFLVMCAIQVSVEGTSGTLLSEAFDVLGLHWGVGGENLSCITLLNIHREDNYFHAHPSSTFSGTPERFVIPRSEIISATSTDIKNRGSYS
jgi:hypothetical protein